MIIRCGSKIVGWPQHIPFDNLSNLKGGATVLVALRDAWNDGTLCFEPATPEDLKNAARDPRSVHPNPALLHRGEGESDRGSDAHPSRAATPSGPHPTEPILMPLVLHPGDLSILGYHPTSTQPGSVL